MGPGAVAAIAAAPDWPDSRLIIVVRNQQVFRSPDGGLNWQRLTVPFPTNEADIQYLGFSPSTSGTPTLYALIQNITSDAPWSLFRSTDAGTTWLSLATGPRVATRVRLSVSPNFLSDNLLFLIVDGHLRRSRDRGETWTEVLLPEDQRAQQLVFSPDFARDQTAFVSVATRDTLPPLDQPGGPPLRDHSDSAGVLVSYDGGDAWTPTAAGMEEEGTPFRNVHSLAISPTFADDGTLLVFVWGPIATQAPDFSRYTWSSRIFRSRDGGITWEQSSLPSSRAWGTTASLALSPTFSSDGIAFAAVNYSGPTPATSGCSILRTDDAGARWTVVVPSVQSYACSRIQALGSGPDFSLVFQRGGEWAATPGGLAERLLRRLGDGPAELSPVSYSIAAVLGIATPGRDPSTLVGALGGGVWSFGPDVQSTDGRLPCSTDVGIAFASTWSADPLVRDWLGCPTTIQQPIRVREIRTRAQGRALRAYWTEDTDPRWFELYETFWIANRKESKGWPDTPSQTLDGIVQRFDGGILIRLPRAGGTGTILEMVGSQDTGSWRELPAPPLVLPTPFS